MTWLTDDEQKKLLDEEPGPITGKIERAVTKRLAKYVEKIEQHEKKIAEHDGFIARLRRGLGAAVKGS